LLLITVKSPKSVALLGLDMVTLSIVLKYVDPVFPPPKIPVSPTMS
jgi:hypothetical protein